MTRNSPGRARQRPPHEVGITPWQRDFWLLLIEHAQRGQLGQPDLSKLPGFTKPAVTRFAATTPDLLRSFRAYNRDKPYHRQVRPFGFMLMFQLDEEELDAIWSSRRPAARRVSTMLRIIAPFDRNPAKAAKQAFDRDTGKSVPLRQLKRYARALQSYYAHPEAKFLNSGHADRGPTRRRHVIVRSIRHIGKEANKLDTQLAMGVDPAAQAEFGTGHDDRKARMAALTAAADRFGSTVLAQEAGMSRQHLSALLSGKGRTTASMLERLERAAVSLTAQSTVRASENEEILEKARRIVSKIGLRKFAALASIDAGHLSRLLAGTRPTTPAVLLNLQDAIDRLSGMSST